MKGPAAAADPQRREAFFDSARTLTPYLALETGRGELFFVRTDDQLGMRLFVRKRRKDGKMLINAVKRIGEYRTSVEGSTFVDVGANIGTTTVLALRRHPFSRAVAIEPSPENFKTLRLNLTANDVDRAAIAIESAVSDKEGERTLVLSSDSSGKHVLNEGVLESESPAMTVPVQTVTLDGLAARGELAPAEVGLLWIDAAGNEANVLAGASTLIEAGVPITTAVRFHRDSWSESREALVELLASYTDFALLRGACEQSNDLGTLLNGLQRNSDVLAVRR